MDRAADLRADYEQLGRMLDSAETGQEAAALARERRIIGVELEKLEKTEGRSLVDELASKRSGRRGSESSGPRRKSGRSARSD